MVPAFLYLLLLICSTQSLQPNEQCGFGTYPPKDRPDIPSYVIHLDLPPAKRWIELGQKEAKQIKEIFDALKETLLNVTEHMKYVIDYVDNNLGTLADSFPYPYGDEMKGLANATKLPLGEVVLYNIFYEIFTFCTSILAHDGKGNLYHARNLDFGVFLGWDSKHHNWRMTDILKRSVVNLEWKDQGRSLFKSVGFAGYLGILTGVKPGVLSLTINERFSVDGGYLGILKWLLGYRESNWLMFLTRQVMEGAHSFEEAKQWLTSKELLAPVYFILGGNSPKEACVITRSRKKTLDVWNMDLHLHHNSTFHLVQTNHDHWEKPPFFDDRITTASKCMEILTMENVGVRGLFDVLSSKPVLNMLTTYTTVMHVATGKMVSYLQTCPEPCPPW